MFILLNKKKMSLSVWSSSSSFFSSSSLHPPSSLLSLLSYTGTCKIITFKPWSYLRETGENAPTFYQNKNYFTKMLPILFAKMTCLINKFYSNDIMCDVMSCNSRFVQ